MDKLTKFFYLWNITFFMIGLLTHMWFISFISLSILINDILEDTKVFDKIMEYIYNKSIKS